MVSCKLFVPELEGRASGMRLCELLTTTPVFGICRRKQAAAASRKDAKLQYVVISEKWDK